LNRRQLLKLVATIAGSQLIALQPMQSLAGQRLSSLFNSPDALRLLGRTCLAKLPDNNQALLLMSGLNKTLSNDDELLQSFATKRHEDFSHGRILTIDGWIMAEAECALCALIALT